MNMHKLWYLAVTTVIFVGAPSAVMAQTPSKVFKNCTELRKVYPKGVAKSTRTAGNTGATVNSKVYMENIKSDRDRDGIACER